MKRIYVVLLTAATLCSLNVFAASAVAPNGFENVEGPNGGLFVTGGPLHTQEYFLANQFQAMQGGANITDFRWRVDQNSSSIDIVFPILTIRMATTPALVSVSDINQNLGSSILVFTSKPLHIFASNRSPGPSPFEITYTLDQPYYYDPALGNLLLDFQFGGTSGGPSLGHLDSASTTSVTWLAAGQSFTSAPITQFNFQPIPEPMPWALFITAASLITFITRNRR